MKEILDGGVQERGVSWMLGWFVFGSSKCTSLRSGHRSIDLEAWIGVLAMIILLV